MERSAKVMRVSSVILLALLCASCSANLAEPESNLSRAIVRLMNTYRETGGFIDISEELCGDFTRDDLERSVRELGHLGGQFKVINNDASGLVPERTGAATFRQGAQFMYTQHFTVYVNEDVGYCRADIRRRFDFAF